MSSRSCLRSVCRSVAALRLSLLTLLLLWLAGAASSAYAQLPDLVCPAGNVKLVLPASGSMALGSGNVQMTVRVYNKSLYPTTVGVTVNIWASLKSTIYGGGTGEVLCATYQVPPLAGGAVFDQTITFNPATVGPYQNQSLDAAAYPAFTTYYLAAQVDAQDQVRESNENNIYNADKPLALTALAPSVPFSFLPPSTSSIYSKAGLYPFNTSVDRQLEWTTSTNASRYDVYLSRLKDTTQRFYPHWLLDHGVGTQKIVATDLEGPFDSSLYNNWGSGRGGISKGSYREPELLITQDNHLFMYYNKNQFPDAVTPQYFDPVELLQTTATSSWNYGKNYEGSMIFGVGTITSVLPVNVNFYTRKDSLAIDISENYMDVVTADYISGDSAYGVPSTRAYEGSVYLLLNTCPITTTTKGIPISRPESLTWDKRRLDNTWPTLSPPVPKQNDVHPYGIKSLAAADFDNDSDVDIVAGSDRFTGNYTAYQTDRIVFWQNSLRQQPDDKAKPTTEYLYNGNLTFVPYAPRGALNTGLSDAQDMCVGDFDHDGRIDIAVASYYDHCVYILHNETDTGGDIRTTRTLSFSVQPALQAFQLDGITTDPLHGAYTLCSCDLNNDKQADLVAGGYIDGRVVVYENRSTYSGDTMYPYFIPHVLTDNNNPDPLLQLPNITKVTCADMNGDGLMDIIACSPTNSKIIWFENQGNYKFVPHLVTESAASVSSIAVTDLTGDMVPDILAISHLDKSLTWFANWPILDGSKKVASNLIQPHFKTAKPFDFWTTYAWMVDCKATDVVHTESPYMFFRTQASRVKLSPTLGQFQMIEPGAGVYSQFHASCDGLQRVTNFAVMAYADPIFDRAFFLGNVGMPYALKTRFVWMDSFNRYDYNLGYNVGQQRDLSVAYDGSILPEGLYNFYLSSYGATDLMEDGARNGIIDGVPDGFDNVLPWTMGQLINNPIYGDDVYLAPEKLGVMRKPGVPDNPTPANNSINVPTTQQFSWTGGTAASGFDILMAKSSQVAPTFTSTTISTTLPTVSSIDTTDVDGDGLIDLAASYFYNTTWHTAWFQNQGGGRRFTLTNVGSPLAGPADVTFAKMIKGGTKPDMLVASPADAKIMWYQNVASPTQQYATQPTQPYICATADGVNTARAADFDNPATTVGAGRMDVVAAMSGMNGLSVFQAQDDFGFAYKQYIVEPITSGHGLPMYAIPADVNGDGLMDIVASFWYPNSVCWYENTTVKNGPLTFVRHEISTTVNMPRALAVGDMNNDNTLDIVCVGEKDSTIYWFMNDGAVTTNFTQNFTQWTVASGLTGVHSIVLTDYNHDAHLDIVTATTAGNKILYLLNGGGAVPTFTPFTIGTQKSSITALAAADVDGDVFPEVIASNANGTMSWFDYVLNYQFGGPLTKDNNALVSATTYQTASPLDPAMGYQWQVLAKRQVEIYGGTLERVTTSSANRGDMKPWTFFTGQSDLVASIVKIIPSSRTITQGDTFQIQFMESNIGLSDSGGHYTEFWASMDSTVNRSGDDVLLAQIWIPGVKAGTNYIDTITINSANVGVPGGYMLYVPFKKPYQTYTIGMFSNTIGDNSESRYDNNKFIFGSKLFVNSAYKNAVGKWNTYQ